MEKRHYESNDNGNDISQNFPNSFALFRTSVLDRARQSDKSPTPKRDCHSFRRILVKALTYIDKLGFGQIALTHLDIMFKKASTVAFKGETRRDIHQCET